LKPTIAKVHGFAVAGGSDIALSCDMVVMADDARIGYMPARVWGCPTTAMWVYRLGAERAKRMLFTGDTIDGRTASEWGLVLESAPPEELAARVEALADRIAGVPTNQLAMQKLMINQAYDNMGLHGTQILATLFDGITRHSPEGRWFQEFAAAHGFQDAVKWRDSGRWIPEGGGPVPSRADLEDCPCSTSPTVTPTPPCPSSTSPRATCCATWPPPFPAGPPSPRRPRPARPS